MTRIDPGQDFVFANLHGRRSGFLRGEGLRRIAQSGSPDVLLRAISGRGVKVASLDEARRELVRELGGELTRTMTMVDARTAAFHEAFLRRFWYEDLKTILHMRLLGEEESLAKGLLVDMPGLPRLSVSTLLAARNGAAFVAALPPAEQGLAEVVDRLAEDGNIPRADTALDCRFFAGLLAAARRCPLSSRGLARELVEGEIDMSNLVTILRNRRTYHLPTAEVVSLCLPDGPATSKRLLELAEAKSLTDVADLLPRRQAACLRGRELSDLPQIEDALRQWLHRLACVGFRDYECPQRSSVAYPYLKWTETLNLGRLCEGMRFGLDATELSSLLIREDARV
jgi:vacuolar-type H+-ATPase subunit C/Vma6